MSLNPQQLYRTGVILDHVATDLRQTLRTSGGFKLSGDRLTRYARQLKSLARRLEQTQRSIDGARSSRMHITAQHRSDGHQSALDAVQSKTIKVALLLEQVMIPAGFHGMPGRGAEAVVGAGPNKLNKRSVTDIALKLEKLLRQSQSQLSVSTLSELNSTHAKITAAQSPAVPGTGFAPLLMTVAIMLECARMWGIVKGKITAYHE